MSRFHKQIMIREKSGLRPGVWLTKTGRQKNLLPRDGHYLVKQKDKAVKYELYVAKHDTW